MSRVRTDRLRRWAAALESGDYQQGTAKLHAADTFCCLGVACDVSGVGRWAPPHHGSRGYQLPGVPAHAAPHVIHPSEVDGWFGCRINELPHTGEDGLWWENDRQHGQATFDDIALFLYLVAEAVEAGDLEVE